MRRVLVSLATAMALLLPLAASATTFRVNAEPGISGGGDRARVVSPNPFEAAQGQVNEFQGAAKVGTRELEEVVGSIIKGALSLLGVVFFGLMVWAGYLWMTAHGEEDKITQAKKMISGAIIGLAIVLAAYAVTTFVVGRLTSADVGVLNQ